MYFNADDSHPKVDSKPIKEKIQDTIIHWASERMNQRAAADEFSYKGPLDSDNVREGEFFVAEFFKKIAWGKTIRESFIEAVDLTEQFTQSTGMGSINAPPYFDRSEQHPLLDDNGDKIGSNNLCLNEKSFFVYNL